MTGLVLSCEHASWTLPPDVELGVARDALQSQAGWDHGAYDIIALLSEHTGIAVHAGSFTRMFVDLNRGPDHPDVCPAVSYGAPVPGNAHLSPGDRATRLAEFHAPYWDAVRRECKARMQDADGGEVLHLSSHTFDPALDRATRTFDVGVLYDPGHAFEAALAERLLFQLRTAGLDVRANQPYSGVGAAICTALRTEFASQRYAGIQLETSHRVTHTPGGCARVAAAVIPFLDSL